MNENFYLRLHQEKSYESFFSANSVQHKLTLHCLLGEGTFIFDDLKNDKQSPILTLEVDKAIFDTHAQYTSHTSIITGPAMTLQLLELLHTLKQGSYNKHEIEIMSFALCATAMAISCAKESESPVNFSEAEKVYAVIQNWKSSPTRLTGKPWQYKPTGMTRSNFLMLINQLYNCSANDLLYEINMQKAMSMLLKSQEGISIISEQSGYRKKENFIAAFRNTYGVTPGRLKKHFR